MARLRRDVGRVTVGPENRYVLPGGDVVVPASVCELLVADPRFLRFRAELRGDHPELDAVLISLTVAGLRHREPRVADSGQISAPSSATAEGSAEYVGCSLATEISGVAGRTIRRACGAGELPARRVGRQWWIDRHDLDRWVAARRAA